MRPGADAAERLAPGAEFDLVISTGLFDYLPDADAAALAAQMCALRAPGGTVVICNFAPCDPSRTVTDWICDWPLIYRDATQLHDIFAPGTHVELDHAWPGLRHRMTARKYSERASRFRTVCRDRPQ